MYIGLHVKYRLFLSDFNETLMFSTDFQKNTQISNFISLFHRAFRFTEFYLYQRMHSFVMRAVWRREL